MNPPIQTTRTHKRDDPPPCPQDYNDRMRYRLRTLLFVFALGPPLLAALYWKVQEHEERRSYWEHVRKAREAGLPIGVMPPDESFPGWKLPPGARRRYPPPSP